MTTPSHFDIINIQGYTSFAIYIHYFLSGSLRLKTIIIPVSKETLPSTDFNTRRWLEEEETPYPGYCRAPGTAQCLPLLCDCEKLLEIWTKLNDSKKNLTEDKEKSQVET